MKFNCRKWVYLNRESSKSIAVEVAGFNSNAHFRIGLDGCEQELKVAFWILGIQFYLTFHSLLNNRWYPERWSKYINNGEGGMLCDEKEISINFHNWAVWWVLWRNDDEWNNKDWRHSSWHPFRNFKGKHTYEKIELEKKIYTLPFFEGNYSVEVFKFQRIDKWQRWFTKKMTSFEVKAGYYDNGKWIAKPIPVEGKGENSWDCDEDATYSMSFPGPPYRKDLHTTYDASLYFWHSMMKSRERYGHSNWTPKSYGQHKLNTLR